jgi:hypothetical protein
MPAAFEFQRRAPLPKTSGSIAAMRSGGGVLLIAACQLLCGERIGWLALPDEDLDPAHGAACDRQTITAAARPTPMPAAGLCLLGLYEGYKK